MCIHLETMSLAWIPIRLEDQIEAQEAQKGKPSYLEEELTL